jgi:starch synthase
LLKEHGFDPLFSGPIFGMVCRLTEQKGVQLLLANEDLIEASKCKLIVIGSGDARLEERMRNLALRLPKKVSFAAKLDEAGSHRIEAGADFFLMPSLFEPCGLNQMYSQVYGTIPIATRVGGLIDTVVDIADDPENGTGILESPDDAGLARGFERALELYGNRKAYAAVQARGMAMDFGWANVVGTYEEFYEDIV